jgi:hypothetical protein
MRTLVEMAAEGLGATTGQPMALPDTPLATRRLIE